MLPRAPRGDMREVRAIPVRELATSARAAPAPAAAGGAAVAFRALRWWRRVALADCAPRADGGGRRRHRSPRFARRGGAWGRFNRLVVVTYARYACISDLGSMWWRAGAHPCPQAGVARHARPPSVSSRRAPGSAAGAANWTRHYVVRGRPRAA